MDNITCKDDLQLDSIGTTKENIYNFVDKLFIKMDGLEDRIGKEVDMMADNYQGVFASFLILDDTNNKYNFVEVINSRVKHGVPIYTFNFLTNLIKKLSPNSDFEVEYVHYPLPLTAELEEQRGQMNNN